MRKLLSTLSATLQGGVRGWLLFLALVATTSLWAYDFQSGDLYYNITSSSAPYTVEVTYEQEWSSYNYFGLTSVTIPSTVRYKGTTYSVTSIGFEAFLYCRSLTSITIPNGVTSIGNSAFWGCYSLTSITIPNSVTSIGDYAFMDCSGLTSVTIPNSVTSIGDYAFMDCSGLTSVIIPNSVTIIGDGAFYDCDGLTSVTIPNSVTSIGYRAFYDCDSLATITIPNSVTSIGDAAFAYCSSLASPVYNAHCFAYMPTSFKGAYVIPEGIKQIAGGAFFYCSLTSVTIPNSVTSIGDAAFAHCSSLTSVTIPNSVTSIGSTAFAYCSSLTSITIPNSVTSIRKYAFYYCSSLDTLTCLAMTPPALGEYVFDRCDNPTLSVPCAALSDYQLHEQWGQFTTIECISSEEIETEDVVIEYSTTTVTITWPTEDNADTYTIVIKKGNEVFCTLTFNADGQLISIAFAPGRDGNHPAQYAEAVANGKGFRFTITGLEEGTHYTYNIDVKNTADQTINSHSGEFTTQSTTAVDNITTTTANIQKIMRNGQLIILRDGVEYNAMGAQIQ